MHSGIKLYNADEAQAEISSSSPLGRSRAIHLTVFAETNAVGEDLETKLTAWLEANGFRRSPSSTELASR